MSIVQIEHVQLAMPPSKEPDARRFYTLGLGLDEVRKPENLAARGGCWFELGNVRVHLGIDTDFRPAKRRTRRLLSLILMRCVKNLMGLGIHWRTISRSKASVAHMSRTRSAIG